MELLDSVYLSSSNLFVGFEIGILFTALFYKSDDELNKMNLVELYTLILFEIIFLSIVIYAYSQMNDYTGSPFENVYGYSRQKGLDNIYHSLFPIALLIGTDGLRTKIKIIINKIGFFLIDH
jgi:hypothetical protein